MRSSLLLLTLLASGCLASTQPPAPTSPEAADPGPDLTAPVLRLEECAGGVANVELPSEVVRGLVPSDFRLSGYSPASASVLLNAQTCERVIIPGLVQQQVSVLSIAAFAAPRNDSWKSPGTHYYLLDTFTSTPELAAAFTEWGLPAETAAFEISTQPTKAETGNDAWDVRAAGCSIQFEFQRTGQRGSAGSGEYHRWSGVGTFTRIQAHQGDRQDLALGAGFVRTEGSCASARAFGAAAPYASHAIDSFNAEFSRINQTYTQAE